MRALYRCLLSYLLLALTPAIALAQSTVTGVNTIGASLPIGAGGGVAMTVLSNGNVGVGTVAPIQKFVVSNGGAEGLELNPIRENANTFALFATNRSTGNPVDLYFGANAFHFQTPIDSNERFTITSTGNVGIDTPSPSVPLYVTNVSSSPTRTTYIVATSTDYTIPISMQNQSVTCANGGDWGFGINGSSPTTFGAMPTGAFWIHHDCYGAPLVITNSGNVGIGILAPGARLDVDGMTYLESNVGIGVAPTASYGLDVNGTVLATAYYHSSDARLKTAIHPINHALDKILALKGVEFNWKKGSRPDMGVTAQNVSEVFPNVVTKGPDGMMSVEYDSMIGPMIEAIRELKAENDRLAARVDFLEKSVSEEK